MQIYENTLTPQTFYFSFFCGKAEKHTIAPSPLPPIHKRYRNDIGTIQKHRTTHKVETTNQQPKNRKTIYKKYKTVILSLTAVILSVIKHWHNYCPTLCEIVEP